MPWPKVQQDFEEWENKKNRGKKGSTLVWQEKLGKGGYFCCVFKSDICNAPFHFIWQSQMIVDDRECKWGKN